MARSTCCSASNTCAASTSAARDDGLTWSQPVEITPTFEKFRAAYDWKVLATGPNHSIQLRTGRLIVPVWLSTGTGGNAHRPSVTATIYSDDQGKTWHAGDIAVPCTDDWINPNETVAIELADGRVMLNVRSESKTHRRLVTISKDGATGWSTPKFDDALLEPICMAGIVRYSTASSGGKNRILFSNPHNLDRADGKAEAGQEPRPQERLRQAQLRRRPDLGGEQNRRAGLQRLQRPRRYARPARFFASTAASEKPNFAGDRLTLARFNLEWLTDGRDDAKPSAR